MMGGSFTIQSKNNEESLPSASQFYCKAVDRRLDWLLSGWQGFDLSETILLAARRLFLNLIIKRRYTC